MQISYAEFLKKTSFSHEELIAFGQGNLVSNPPLDTNGLPDFPSLPSPPFLMFHRVKDIQKKGSRGRLIGEQDIRLDDWFFQCHFKGDPVQPGCLGVDAVWQLLGFYATLCGGKGSGRALGAREIEFFGQIRPYNKLVTYDIEVKRFMGSPTGQATFVIGSATVLVDHEPIYAIKDAKVGCFPDLKYRDYPLKSENAVGGRLSKDENESGLSK